MFGSLGFLQWQWLDKNRLISQYTLRQSNMKTKETLTKWVIHTIQNGFWHIIWKYVIMAYILTSYLASILTYFLAYILTFFVGIYSSILPGTFSGIHSGILSNTNSDILLGIFSLACVRAQASIRSWRHGVRVQAWPTASGARDMVFGPRRRVKEGRKELLLC